MSEQEQQKQSEPKQADKSGDEAQPQMEGDNVVDTNAGDDATQGTIADVDPEEVRNSGQAGGN